jgi:hypothetical protein
VAGCPGGVGSSGAMDTEQFWGLIEDARSQAVDAVGVAPVAAGVVALLSARPAAEIIAAEHRLWELLARSYRNSLWAAACLIQGGCSDDGFEYFRGWLILQGRSVFEAALADPDSLAGHPAVQAAVAQNALLEYEEALYIASEAYELAVGEEMPADWSLADYPELESPWDFADRAGIQRRLPRLAALCWRTA